MAKLATPRQNAIGVPISISSVKTPNRIQSSIALRPSRSVSTFELGGDLGGRQFVQRVVDRRAAQAQHDALQREQQDSTPPATSGK